MIIAPLLAALLSVSASAQTSSCLSNEMTVEWEKINFALTLSDYTIPDSTPRAGTLSYRGCSASEGRESRTWASADGRYVVTALTSAGGQDGATSLVLSREGESAPLGTWGHHKVFYKGVGIDKVSVPNGNGRTVIKNVFVIPESTVVKP